MFRIIVVAMPPPRDGAKGITIHVPVCDVEAGPFPIEANGEFWLEIDGEATAQVRFRDERLRITEDGLELTYWLQR